MTKPLTDQQSPGREQPTGLRPSPRPAPRTAPPVYHDGLEAPGSGYC